MATKKRRPYKVKREQPRKDSRDKRVNLDNVREDKLKKDIDDYSKKGANDISWYARNPEMLRSAATVPYASILGVPVFPNADYRVPGVMAFTYNYAFGSPDDSGYPYALNQAGKSIYSYVVHANSRNYNYEYQDLMTIIMAGAQIFSAIAAAIRVYGLAHTYQENSLYAPDGIIAACGFDPDNIRNSLSNMWFDINNLIAQTQQIWIPNTVPLIQRWFWLNTNVFKDDQDPLGQVYLFRPGKYLMYNEIGSSDGGILQPAYSMATGSPFSWDWSFAGQRCSWPAFKSMIQVMIDALVNSEDRGIMFGDILKAYGPDKIYQLAPIPSDYKVVPVYNAEVLTQIEGMTMHTNNAILGLTQDSKGLKPIYQSFTSATGHVSPLTVISNFHHTADPTPEEVMIATRLAVAGTKVYKVTEVANASNVQGAVSTTINNIGIYPTITFKTAGNDVACVPMVHGTEIMERVHVFTVNPTADGGVQEQLFSTINTTAPTASLYESVMPFDWAPFIYQVSAMNLADTNHSAQGTVIYAFGDYSNYTTLSTEVLRKLHDTACFSLFGIPHM